MSNDRSMAERWSGVGTRMANMQRRLDTGSVCDEADVRAEIANILHTTTLLYELEVRRMAMRQPGV